MKIRRQGSPSPVRPGRATSLQVMLSLRSHLPGPGLQGGTCRYQAREQAGTPPEMFSRVMTQAGYFRGSGELGDHRIAPPSFVLISREMSKASWFGVTDRAVDEDPGNTGSRLAHPRLASVSYMIPG